MRSRGPWTKNEGDERTLTKEFTVSWWSTKLRREGLKRRCGNFYGRNFSRDRNHTRGVTPLSSEKKWRDCQGK